MKCLVTGAAGFLGSHMIDRLRADGHTVTGLDRRAADASMWSADITWSLCGIQSHGELVTYDWIFHFAGLAAIPPSMEIPADYMAVNVQGTVNVLELARHTGAKVLYAASGTTYGFHPEQPTAETEPSVLETPYALSKWMGEEACLHWDRVFHVPTVSLRLFGPYGPRMLAASSGIGTFLECKRKGVPITLAGDGNQYRDWVYVSDAIEAFVLAAQSDVHGEVFNIASGQAHTLNELVRLLDVPFLRTEGRREARGTLADIGKARRLLGWSPKVAFADGVRMMLEAEGLA